jgi:spore coat protein U-like protein
VNRLVVLLLLALAAPMAWPATVCRLVGGVSMGFGSYDYFSTLPNDSQASVSVSCDRNGGQPTVTVTMRIDQGANGAGVGSRRMLHAGGSGDLLNYGLYRDVARSQVWGVTDTVDTMSTTLAIPNKGSASASFTVYGRIPVRQDLSAGNYADSVQITILY